MRFNLFQVVQEYERAVIFRLGRLLSGGAKGPGKIITRPSAQLTSANFTRTTFPESFHIQTDLFMEVLPLFVNFMVLDRSHKGGVIQPLKFAP